MHVLKQLADQGVDVVSMSTRGTLDGTAMAFLGPAAERVKCLKLDILDLEGLRGAIREYEIGAVVHGAAVTAIGETERRQPREAVMVNVCGTATALEAARLEGVRRFVYLSSALVYGSSDPTVPISEDQPPRPSGIYAVTKHAAECLVLRYGELFEFETALLRISAPYGPLEHPTGGRQLLSLIHGWCRAALAGGTVRVEGDLARDFTYVGDTAAGIALAATVPSIPRRLYNLACGRNISFREVLSLLKTLCPGLRVIEVTAKEEFFFRESQRGPLAIDRARRELGFIPATDLVQGLKTYLEWLTNHAH